MTAYNNFLHGAMPIYILSFLIIALSVVSALIADRVYKKYVTFTLSEAAQIHNPLIFSNYFLRCSGCNMLAAFTSLAAALVIPNIVSLFIQ